MTLPICAAPGAMVMKALGRAWAVLGFDLRVPQGFEGAGMPNG